MRRAVLMHRALWRWTMSQRYPLSTTSKVTHGTPAVVDAGPADGVALHDTQSRILTAAILARNPIVLRPLSEFELAYEEYRQVLQAEQSRGTFDIMTAQRRELEELRGNSGGNTGNEHGSTRPERTMSPKDSLHPTYTQADSDPTSLLRRLERKLYFVVKNERDQWRFPAAHVTTADTGLHKLTVRMLRRLLGGECELYPMGTAPVAYHGEGLDDRVAPPYEIKTFFFRSQLIAGRLKFRPEAGARSFAWLTREELQELLSPAYFKSISRVLSY